MTSLRHPPPFVLAPKGAKSSKKRQSENRQNITIAFRSHVYKGSENVQKSNFQKFDKRRPYVILRLDALFTKGLRTSKNEKFQKSFKCHFASSSLVYKGIEDFQKSKFLIIFKK